MARSELVGATPAQRHRLVAAAFTDRVDRVSAWEVLARCTAVRGVCRRATDRPDARSAAVV
jgi:hypothetical protein